MSAHWKVVVVGIGSGTPGHLTGDAIAALQHVALFLVAEKRAEVTELVELREALCRAVIRHDRYRFVAVPDPRRDAAGGYTRGVADWHRIRAERDAAMITAELPAGGTVGYLVWGDPSLYDSTLRKIERITELGLSLHTEVFPGLGSPSLLAAAHRVPLNRVGHPVHLTTGRRLLADWAADLGDLVVLLDDGRHLRDLAQVAPRAEVFWGAQLGLPSEQLIRGPLGDVSAEITAVRAELRDRHGWVLDTYLLRRPEPVTGD